MTLALFLLIFLGKAPFIPPIWKQLIVGVGYNNFVHSLYLSFYLIITIIFLLSIKKIAWRNMIFFLPGFIVITRLIRDPSEIPLNLLFFFLGIILFLKRRFNMTAVLIAGLLPELTHLIYAERIFDYKDIILNEFFITFGYCLLRRK